ncbi:MAG: tyrosine--tRNA ligase [Puniceicoccales bacterium]|nr:tyrosine--tRNA ligase [Puniceicoccales bacterium]
MIPGEQIQKFRARAEVFHGEEEILTRLQAGKRLRVKLGVDPTRPDLTFGHMVVLNKLRQFQDCGHQAVLVIGDFTTRIGDPSGRSTTRPVLTEEEINANAATYLAQAEKILDPHKTEVRRNSEWFGEMSFQDALALSRQMTVARMLERDDFSKRHGNGTPISLIEFLYPLLQGHDSVVLDADIELGGSDQLFNMLVGRQLQKEAGKPGQAVLAMPLLVGLDGERKMSKSYDNYIAFNHAPKDMFGRVMSIPDPTMWIYYRHLLETPDGEIARLQAALHPMEAKKQLAARLVARFHGGDVAAHERAQFEKVFTHHEVRDDMPQYAWGEFFPGDATADAPLVDILAATRLFPSKKEIRRLIEQGAVRVDGEKIDDASARIRRPAADATFQAGKRTFFKLRA